MNHPKTLWQDVSLFNYFKILTSCWVTIEPPLILLKDQVVFWLRMIRQSRHWGLNCPYVPTVFYMKKYIFWHYLLLFFFSPFSFCVQSWLRSQRVFWPQPVQMTSPSFLHDTISTRTKTQALNWYVTSVRQAPMCPSTALWRLWGNAAPALRVPSPEARTVFSSVIAAALLVLWALSRKCLAQPPKIVSAPV